MESLWHGSLPWHPFIVHFPIALWVTGSVVSIVALATRKTGWQDGAWVLMILAAVISIPAALSGQSELQRLSGDLTPALARHRDLGNLLPWLMCILAALKLHTRFAGKSINVPDGIWCLCASIITIILLYTGYLGGVTVYFDGVGTR